MCVLCCAWEQLSTPLVDSLVSAPQWVLQRGFHDRLSRRAASCRIPKLRKLHDFARKRTFWKPTGIDLIGLATGNTEIPISSTKNVVNVVNPRKTACLYMFMGFQEHPRRGSSFWPGFSPHFSARLRSYPLGWWDHPLTRWTDPAVFTTQAPV